MQSEYSAQAASGPDIYVESFFLRMFLGAPFYFPPCFFSFCVFASSPTLLPSTAPSGRPSFISRDDDDCFGRPRGAENAIR